jgi:hypothetical protein
MAGPKDHDRREASEKGSGVMLGPSRSWLHAQSENWNLAGSKAEATATVTGIDYKALPVARLPAPARPAILGAWDKNTTTTMISPADGERGPSFSLPSCCSSSCFAFP